VSSQHYSSVFVGQGLISGWVVGLWWGAGRLPRRGSGREGLPVAGVEGGIGVRGGGRGFVRMG